MTAFTFTFDIVERNFNFEITAAERRGDTALAIALRLGLAVAQRTQEACVAGEEYKPAAG